ncbi:MAG: OmpA family protein [Ignavibacteria bacterium]|nr:OmpA family protein [Ignavibacteria bacterium]
MKKMFAILTLTLLIPLMAYSQFHGYKVKGGVQGHFLYPLTELTSDQFSWMGRGFLNVELAKHFGLELGFGYGEWRMTDELTNYPYPANTGIAAVDDKIVQTQIIPIDLRLRISPFNLKSVNPYFWAGGGVMRYIVQLGEYAHNDKEPWIQGVRTSEMKKQNGWAPNGTVGTGLEVKLADGLLFDVNAGFTYYFDDMVNNVLWGDMSDAQLNIGLGLTFSGIPDADDDKDGLLTSYEEKIGTDPYNPDTDGDGLKDGQEVKTYGTDPLNKDSDNDGLTDYEEVMKYTTNPMNPDTDGDGLKDGDEVNIYKTNPKMVDTDGDGLSDGDEVLIYKTDPLLVDTDGDGLTDGDEVSIYTTNPTNPDTDGDGLTDGDEVNKYKTNPLKADTDGGSVDDGVEVKRGTDPLDPADDVEKRMEVGEKVILEGINFETNSWVITFDSEEILQNSLKYIQQHPDESYEISGHTDSRGSRSHNMTLSQNRANSVKQWLVDHGVDASRLTTIGYGPDDPVAPNDTPENMYKNRRIEFKRTK